MYRRALAVVALVLLLSSGAFRTASGQGIYAVTINRVDGTGFPTVTAFVTVSDTFGLPLAGLQSTDFEVLEDDRSVSGLSIQPAINNFEPVALALALDLSGSMQGAPLADALQATTRLVEQLSPADTFALVTFSQQPTLVAPSSTDRTSVLAALPSLQARGGTALWDGAHQAIQQLAAYPPGRRAVVLVTDGQDMNSLLTFDDVAGEAARENLPIFCVGFGSVDKTTLERLARLTGGEASVLPTSADLQTQLEAILGRLRQQYVVTFASDTLADGAEHRITVRALRDGAQAEASATYIATPLDYTLSLPDLEDGQSVGMGLPYRLVPEVSAPVAITSVEYLLDGTPMTSVTSPPFEFMWIPDLSQEGSRVLTVRATNPLGQIQELDLQLKVIPPLRAVWVLPKPDASVSGQVTLEADVQALGPGVQVEFLLDGQSIGEAASEPFTLDWDSGSATAGLHELRVIATDDYGNSASDTRTIRVQVGINWGIFVVIALVIVAAGLIVPFSLRRRREQRTIRPAAMAAESIEPRPNQSETLVAPSASATAGRAMLHLDSGSGESWALTAQETRLGRQRTENDIVLAGTDVSRRQAVVRQTTVGYTLINLSQTQLPRVNGQDVLDQVNLADGDRIEIGSHVLRFTYEPELSGQSAHGE